MPVNDWLKNFGNPKFYEVFKGFLVISLAYENTFTVFENYCRNDGLG